MQNVNISASEINQKRRQSMENLFWNHDNIVIDTALFMERRYKSENGFMSGIDAEPFFERLYALAPVIQTKKYPNGEDKFIYVPESCVCEAVRHAENLSKNSSECAIEGGKIAVRRIRKLLKLNCMKVIADDSLGQFGDSSLIALASQANSRKRLLFLTQDVNLGRDLENMQTLSSIRMNHSCKRIDSYSFPAAIPSEKTEKTEKTEKSLNKAGAKSGQSVVPVSCPRGCGSISRYSCTGQLPQEPDRVLNGVGEMDEGDVLYTADGAHVTLGEEISGGSESQVFRVEGMESFCAKVLREPTFYKQQKVELLASRDFEIDAAVMPEAPLFTAEGVFKGFIMRYISRSIPLSVLFNGTVRDRYIAADPQHKWDREDFVRLGLNLCRAFYQIHVKGALVADVSHSNVRIGLDADGSANPDQVFLIDLDSCQVGCQGGPVYPADGVTKAYAAKELMEEGWKKGQLRNYASELFSCTQLVCRCLMIGLHPYRAINVADDEEFDEAEAVLNGKFPYGSSTERKSVGTAAPGLGAYIWSHMPGRLKNILHKALTCAPHERPPLKELISELEYYIEWISNPETIRKFPQARLLCPSQFKPYMQACSHCGRIFDSANSDGCVVCESGVLCPECAAEAVAKCEVCGKVSMTRGEQLLGKRIRRLCPECFDKGRLLNARRMSYYTSCRSCGRSFPVSYAEAANPPEQCPVCRASGNQDPLPTAQPSPFDSLTEKELLRRQLEELRDYLSA